MELKTKEIKVLNHGFVRLVDFMGNDDSIVQAARVSYGKGTKTVREDEALIRYLLRHEHTSPFEMVEFCFHCKMPIFIARQWVRHRTASINEYSGRYSEIKDEYYIPDEWRFQDKINKQGSNSLKDLENEFYNYPEQATKEYIKNIDSSFSLYKDLLSYNIGKEMARMNLPVASYTEWYWKIDLKNLLHFLKLRLDGHAQKEIQVYGEAIYEIIKQIVPVTCKAFEDYILNAVKFSSDESKIIKDFLKDSKKELFEVAEKTLSKGEFREFQEKMK
jgi:thymidylate synthase (FAD)